MNDGSTKTQKRKKSKANKKELWNKFAMMSGGPDNHKALECVYSTPTTRNKCECCDGLLIIGEEGFMTCSNTTCGIIYKDNLVKHKFVL